MPNPQTNPPTALPTLYTAEDAAHLTGLKLRVIRDAMYTRELTTIKLGRRVYVTEAALTQWLDTNTRNSVTP